jgi:hypothetical protein
MERSGITEQYKFMSQRKFTHDHSSSFTALESNKLLFALGAHDEWREFLESLEFYDVRHSLAQDCQAHQHTIQPVPYARTYLETLRFSNQPTYQKENAVRLLGLGCVMYFIV